MDSFELRDIINKILTDQDEDLTGVASKSHVNRSYLSKVVNSKDRKVIGGKVETKLKNAFPKYFGVSNKNNIANLPEREFFTADQLFAMYMKTSERSDRIIEIQTKILESIESKMARETTLAEVASNLKEVLIDVQSLASRQKGVGSTLLESLERLEKLEDGSLTTEADTRIRQIEKAASKHDSANVRRS